MDRHPHLLSRRPLRAPSIRPPRSEWAQGSTGDNEWMNFVPSRSRSRPTPPTATHNRRTVAGRPVHEAAHNAITDRVRLTGPRRDYRALDMGRYRVVRRRRVRCYGAGVMCGTAGTSCARVCRISDGLIGRLLRSISVVLLRKVLDTRGDGERGRWRPNRTVPVDDVGKNLDSWWYDVGVRCTHMVRPNRGPRCKKRSSTPPSRSGRQKRSR
jgi:hypothetical protein